MTNNKGVINPVCPNCKKKGINFRKDGSVRCKACGYEGAYEVKK
jgi:uncharacterized Zn finger protein (UPF0148 family)